MQGHDQGGHTVQAFYQDRERVLFSAPAGVGILEVFFNVTTPLRVIAYNSAFYLLSGFTLLLSLHNESINLPLSESAKPGLVNSGSVLLCTLLLGSRNIYQYH